MRIISIDLGSIYSSLDLRLDRFNTSIDSAVQGFYRLQLGTEKASNIMDKSVNTAVSNIARSYELWERANERTGHNVFDNSRKIESLRDQIRLLDTEISRSDEILQDIETQFGRNSEEAETYRARVLELRTSQANLTDEMRRAERQTGTFRGRLELLGQEFQRIDERYQAFDKVGDKFKAIGNKLTMGVTMPVVAAGTAATKFAFDFEKGAAKVSTIADTTKVPIEDLKKGVIDLSNETGMSTKELNESLYQAISGSVDTAKAVDFLDVAVKAAKGGFTETSVAVDGLTTVLNSYGLEADKATDISNQMLICQNLGKTTFGELASAVGKVTPIAASLGVTTNELFSSLASTTAQGLATAESVTALKAAMSNIIKPSKEASDAAEQLGIDFSVSAVKSKGWIGFLKDVKQGLEKASPEFAKISEISTKTAERLATLEQQGKKNTDEYKNLKKESKKLSKEFEKLAKMSDSPIGAFAQMFGSVEGLNSILMLTSDQGLKKYNDAMNEMKTNTHALDDAYKKMSETTEAKFNKAMNKAKNSLMELGIKALPVVEKGINLLSDLTDKFSKLSPSTQEWIIKIGLASAALGPFMNVTGGTIKGIGALLKFGPKVKTFFGLFSGARTAARTLGTVSNSTNIVTRTMQTLRSTTTAGTGATIASSGALRTLATRLGTIASISLPVAGGIAAVGGTIYLAHKNTQYLSKSCVKSAEDIGTIETAMAGFNGHVIHTNAELEEMNVKHKEWSKKVSPETQKALDNISNKISNYNMEVKGSAKLDKLADAETGRKLNAKLDDICNSAINKIKSKQPEIKKVLEDSFKADGLDANEKKILDSLNKSGEAEVKKVQDIKKKILDLEKRASKETGNVRQKTLKEVEKLTQQIGNIEMKNTVKSKEELLAAQADFNARMKNLDMQGISKLMESKAKIRDDETKKIKENYDKQIEFLKLNVESVDEETKKAINAKIKQLEQSKEKEINVENEKYKGYLEAAIKQYPQLLNYLDLQHGKMLTKEQQQKQLELNMYASKMKGMLNVTQSGYYQIKDSVTGQMHNCYVEVDKTSGQIVGTWDISTGRIYGNPIKAREDIDKDLKNGVKFEPIVNSYDTKKQEIWKNAIEVQSKTNYNLFDWIRDAHSNAQSWLSKHPFIAGVVQQVLHIGGKQVGENWTGTDNFEGGLTWIDEEGSELIQFPGKGPKLVDLPKGTKIFNHTQSNSIKARLSRKQFKGYATGTDNATPGLHEIAEEGFEIVTDRQYRWFNGGEKVFNHADSKKLLQTLFKNKSNPENIAKEAMAQVRESIVINPPSVSENKIKNNTGHMLNWGANNKKAYEEFLEFKDKLNKEDVVRSKECLKEDYENRVKSLDNRLRILKDENKIELQTEKSRVDTQIEYYQKLQRTTKDKNAKNNYANKIASLRQYQKYVLNTTKANQKAQIDSLETSKKALKEYYDDGMKVLNKREKEVNSNLKLNQNLFKDKINKFDAAIKKLSTNTEDLTYKLQNQKAIVIIQQEKINTLKHRYEELSMTLGATSEKTIATKKAFEDARNELVAMTKTVESTNKEMQDKAVQDVDKLNSFIIKALERKVKAEEKTALETAKIKAKEQNLNKEQLERFLAYVKNIYEKKLDQDILQGQAEQLIMSKNQKTIIQLLNSYGDLYQDAGISLGHKLVMGTKSWSDVLPPLISNTMENVVNTVGQASNAMGQSLSNVMGQIEDVAQAGMELAGACAGTDGKVSFDFDFNFDSVYKDWESNFNNIETKVENVAETISKKYKEAFNRIELAQIQLGRDTHNTDEELEKQQQLLDIQKDKLDTLKSKYNEMSNALGSNDDEVVQLNKDIASLTVELENQENKLNADTIRNKYRTQLEAIELDTLKLTKSTKNLDEELDLQSDIYVNMWLKLETLKDKYEELTDVLGSNADEVKALEKEIISYQNEIDEFAKNYTNNLIANIDTFNSKIKYALKERYTEELKAQEDTVNKELSNLNKWKDESIKRISEVYDAKIKALDDELKAEDKANKDREELKKIHQLEESLKYEHNEFNKIEIQKELNRAIADRNKRLHKENIESQKESLESQKQNEIDNINNLYESNKENLETQLNDTKKFYEDKLKLANLEAESQKLIVSNNQKEIVKLIKSYDKDYENAGKTLGQRLADGMSEKISPVIDLIDSIQDRINNMRTQEIQASIDTAKYSPISSMSSGSISNSTTNNSSTVVNNNNITFNSPKSLAPSEIRRETETTLRNLAFSI